MSDIKVGDYMKAEFTDSPEAGTYTIEGNVHTYGNRGALYLGPRCFQIAGDRIPGFTILEHKPKRMEEPDYGEQVTSQGDSFVRVGRLGRKAYTSHEWVSVNNGLRYRWDELIDPRPVSPI